MPNVEYIRPELAAQAPAIKLISDVLAGPGRVKAEKETYLPRPDPTDKSEDNNARYDAYLARALLLGATGQTLEALVGQVFAKDPVVELPPQMEGLLDDADGRGLSLDGLAKEALRAVLSRARCGILVDHPAAPAEAPRSKADTERLGLRPVLSVWPSESVVNWREGAAGLEMVVLKESVLASDDGFESVYEIGYRRLLLAPVGTEGRVVVVETWRKDKSGWRLESETIPKDASGRPFAEIPFAFAGWRDNSADPDPLPLEALARLEIGHYRNSADYEEACFIAGQPTPVFAGVTEDWVVRVMKNRVKLGSRQGIAVPPGATASLLQAAPNSMPKEAMELKEAQMAKIGAKLVEPSQVSKTATEASLQASAESSVLGSAASNVSKAVENALRFAALYYGVDLGEGESELLAYELNTDFSLAKLSAQDRQQLLLEWQGGGITFEEYRWNLKKGGVAYLDDEEAKDGLETEEV